MAVISFEPLTRPAEFLDGTDDLLETLNLLVEGWDPAPVPFCRDFACFTVRCERGVYQIEAPWLDEPVCEPDPFRAAGNIAVDLAEAYLAENPSLLSLHCAAAIFQERLVIFPGRSKAGKSTLSVALAAAGIPILTDDLLVLTGAEDSYGMSLGLSPRLRLPLPSSADDAFLSFVSDHRGPGTPEYLYMNLPYDLRPRFGKTAPLGAIVLLNRNGEPSIKEASRGDGLQELIFQNLSLGVRASAAVSRMRRLIEGIPCFALHYSDPGEACSLLLERFRDWRSLPTTEQRHHPTHSAGERPRLSDEDVRFVRQPDVVEEAVDGGLFLVCEKKDSIYRLNEVSYGLWNLLSQPTSAREAVLILHGAFPDTDRSLIERDVQSFLNDLLQRGLVTSR